MATTPSVLQPVDGLVGKPPPPPHGGNGGNGNGASPAPNGSHVAVLGVWVALAPIVVLFAAFVSAYVVRQGLGSNWNAIPVPRLLWANTVVLLASSVLLERARRTVGQGAGTNGRAWFLATLLCGVLFVIGQGVAWNQLWARGIGISSSAHSSFFYLLTGTHAVHLAGGLVALTAAAFWPASRYGMSREVVARVTSIYWHFMGILWVGLFFVLSFWR